VHAAARHAPSRTALSAMLAALLAAVTMTAVPGGQATPVELPDVSSFTAPPAVPTAHVADEVRAAVVDGSAVVVVQATPTSVADARQAVVAAGGEVVLDLDIVSGFSARVDDASLDAVASVPGVRHITLDGEVTLAHTGDDSGKPAADSSFVETVEADALHADGIDGSGVGIAVIDTGVSEVPDLEGRVVGRLDISGSRHADVDEYGHGTFIAGVAAGNGASSNGEHAGVAPGAHIVPVKIAGRNGAADVSHVLAAIQYVVSFKDTYDIGVLNLSVGTDSDQPQMLSPLNYAVERAWDSGIVVVVSGGNLGAQGPGRIPKPADDPLVITVGATDSNGTVPRADDVVAGYSSQGPSIADGFEKPDVVAPGSHLVSLRAPGSKLDSDHRDAHVGEAYARGSGTSFAAGVVSGAAALLRQAHPEWTPDQVKEAITTSAAPGPVGERNIDGHGALDVDAARATSPQPDSQGMIVRSTGLGSLEADRGSLEVEVSTTGLFNTLAYLLNKVFHLTGETTAQLEDFDPETYTETDWTSTSWWSTSWWSTSWWSTSWWSTAWWSTSWWSTSWWGR
jgi:serine protease AprX